MVADFDNLDTVMDKVGDMPVSYGLRFRAGRPHTTLHFKRESVHLYVCVDKEYLPVSMALVHPPCVHRREAPRDEDECRRLVIGLYGMSCQLAAWEKLLRDPRQADSVLVRVIDSAKRLEAAETGS